MTVTSTAPARYARPDDVKLLRALEEVVERELDRRAAVRIALGGVYNLRVHHDDVLQPVCATSAP